MQKSSTTTDEGTSNETTDRSWRWSSSNVRLGVIEAVLVGSQWPGVTGWSFERKRVANPAAQSIFSPSILTHQGKLITSSHLITKWGSSLPTHKNSYQTHGMVTTLYRFARKTAISPLLSPPSTGLHFVGWWLFSPITPDNVRPSLTMLRAISEFSTQKNLRDICSWFGLVNQMA